MGSIGAIYGWLRPNLCHAWCFKGDPGESVILSCPEDVNLVPLPGFYRSMLMQDAEGLPVRSLSDDTVDVSTLKRVKLLTESGLCFAMQRRLDS